MIKALAQGIPSYSMSTFRLPLVLCKQLKSTVVNFLLGDKGTERRFIGENGICLCSQKGSWWFRILYLLSFNQALLSQTGLANPHQSNSLPRFFQRKYYPTSNFLRATRGHNPSFVWTLEKHTVGQRLAQERTSMAYRKGIHGFVFSRSLATRTKDLNP